MKGSKWAKYLASGKQKGGGGATDRPDTVAKQQKSVCILDARRSQADLSECNRNAIERREARFDRILLLLHAQRSSQIALSAKIRFSIQVIAAGRK